jgi:hypothetical protein
MKKNVFKFLVTFLLISGGHFIANAQVSLYDFIQSNGTYTELTGATTLATATTTSGAGSLDDINYTLAVGTIPFSFVYDGVSYTSCTVSTNGYITFGTTAPTTTSYTPISATTAYAGAISALGGNLNAYFISGNPAQTGSISYQTLGTIPNRKFVIQFKNFKPQAQSGTTFTTSINFQIALNESSNVIDVTYNLTPGTYTAGSYQVGLRGANNTFPTNIRNRAVVTGTNNWATSVNGSANTSTCGISATLLPAQGLTFRYAPTNCPSPTSLSATQITTNSATVSWTNPVSGGTFTVEYGPVGFTPGTGTTVSSSTTTATITGLSALTSYSFYVQKSCGVGSNSLKVGPSNFSTGGIGEDCSTAPLLSVASSLATCSYTTVSTGVSINGPTSFCSDLNGNQATNDKWFKFVAPANGKKLVLTAQAGTNNDWVMEVWTGCPGGTSYQFNCADDVNGGMPEISICQNEYVAGQTYYVRVWTYVPFSTGTMNLCIYETTMCPVAPGNDNCANAIRLSVNPPLSCGTNARTFLNNFATRNTDAATCDSSLLKSDVWFVFNTGNFSDVDLTINSLTAVNLKAQLLFECGGFEINCWNPGTGTKTITGLNPQADYILRVWTDSTAAGTFSICITDRCSNPTATTNGTYSTCTGNTVSIPVTFTGAPPFSLTYSNGSVSNTVTGITTANYNLVVTPSTTSTYTLTSMTDATCNGLASGSAAVTVITPQTVTLNAFSPVCDNAPAQVLSGGSPSGGVYSGIGVGNGTFDPAFGTQTITYTVTYSVGCTRSASRVYTVNSLPAVSLSSFVSVCSNSAPFNLTGGTPAGGNYVGNGVSNNTFNPSAVNPGTYVITYFYTTPDGCTANDTSTIVVTACNVCVSPPAVNGGVDKTICFNSSASISATIGGAASAQTWSGGSGSYSPNNTSLNITYTPSASEIAAGFARLIITTNDPDGNGPCVAASDTVNISITPAPQLGSISGSISVCRNQNGVTHSVLAQAGLTYTWTVPTGVSIISGQGTNSISTNWGSNAASGNVSISVSNSCSTTSGSLPVSVGLAPTTPIVTGSTSVCRNQTGVTYSITAQAGATYLWTVPTGVTISAGQGTNSITTTWSSTAVSGNVGVSLTNTCGTTSGSLAITVGSAPTTPSVTGSSSVCRNQTGVTYSVTAQVGSTYTWTVPTGVTITAGQGTNSITTTWGSTAVAGNIGISLTNGCGTTSGSLGVIVGLAPTTPIVTGSSSVCLNQTGVTYSVAAQVGATYNWTVPAGVTITVGQGTTSITTTWGSTAVAGNVSVTIANSCGSTSGQLAVAISPATTLSSISGNTSICLPQNQLTYSVTNQTGVTYTWTVPSGVTILSGQGTNQIVTSWSLTAVTGNVSVVGTGICNNASSSLPVTITSGTLAVGAITGNISNCRNTTGVVYSVPAISGATFTWTVPNGVTITAGQGTNTITTSWTSTAVAGNVSVVASTTCSSGSSNLSVGISSGLVVGAITGNSPICRPATGVVYSVVAQPGVTYVWTVPTGVTITAGAGTNSITTSWSSTSVTNNIKVVGTSACGKDSTTRSITVRTAVPTQPSTVTGASTACIGDALVFTITRVATADYYVWTPKTGMLVNGSSTALTTTDTAVTVTFTTGFVGDTLKVNGGNCRGLSTVRTKVITRNTALPTTPGAISGQTTSICGGGSFTYSFASAVTNATSYTWRTKIVGALLNGQAVSSLTVAAPTRSITVTYPPNTSTFDTLFVRSNNGCGSSAERATRINAVPAVPASITTPAVLCIGTTVPQVFSTAAVAGATSYTWTYTTAGTTLVGGQGTTNLTLRFTATGTKAITVRSNNSCGSSTTRSASVNPTAACPTARDGSAYDVSGIVVYPNPTRGNVTIAYTSEDNSDYLLTIYDMSGRLIDTYTLNAIEGYNQKELSLETLLTGTYIVSLKGNGLITQTRLIVE